MIEIKVKTSKDEVENLHAYCSRLGRRNNSVLYLLESYLEKKLLDDEKLTEIRDVVLTVSADITKLSSHVVLEGDENERL